MNRISHFHFFMFMQLCSFISTLLAKVNNTQVHHCHMRNLRERVYGDDVFMRRH